MLGIILYTQFLLISVFFPGLATSATRNPEKIFIPDLPLSVTPESSVAEAENSMYGYACGTCAAIFRTEKEFDIHKEVRVRGTSGGLLA